MVNLIKHEEKTALEWEGAQNYALYIPKPGFSKESLTVWVHRTKGFRIWFMNLVHHTPIYFISVAEVAFMLCVAAPIMPESHWQTVWNGSTTHFPLWLKKALSPIPIISMFIYPSIHITSENMLAHSGHPSRTSAAHRQMLSGRERHRSGI